MSGPLVRRDIWRLETEQEWHPITEAYARALIVMGKRHPDKPESWAYQAAIHGLRSASRGDRFRDKCQHHCWYFLPWHRMYLHWFERTVRAALDQVRGVSDDVKAKWALPFWDYERAPGTAALPKAFRDAAMPDGTPNPLHVAERDPNIKAGGAIAEIPRSSTAAMAMTAFPGTLADGRFGGGVSAPRHNPVRPPQFGGLEARPHNGVHGQVGGDGGFMSDFDTAPLDPVFWLHHANIDRLWATWLTLGGGRRNPQEAAWTTDVRFDFHDEHGTELTQACEDVLDTVGQLGYTYEGLDEARPVDERRDIAPQAHMADLPEHPPELIGASDSLQLRGRASVKVDVSEPTGPALMLFAERDAPQRMMLGIEGVEGEANPGVTYAVYVNLPDGPDPGVDPDRHFAGELSFFGIERTRDLERDHESDPHRHTFDITRIAESLRELGAWDPSALTVTFEPQRPLPPPGGEDLAPPAEERTPVHIGRVSVFVQ